MQPTQLTQDPIDHLFSAPAARSDRWRDIVAAARRWVDGGERADVAAAFAALGATEEFFAYPGKGLISKLEERLEADDAKGFSASGDSHFGSHSRSRIQA